jgi:hypothetical protein
MGPADADIICSSMNLVPLTFGLWCTKGKFSVVEELVAKAEVVETALAMMKEACQEENISVTQCV